MRRNALRTNLPFRTAQDSGKSGLFVITACSTGARRRNTIRTSMGERPCTVDPIQRGNPIAWPVFPRTGAASEADKQAEELAMSDTHLILQTIDPIILLLSLEIVAVILSRQVGLSPIVGYLLLGLALSRTSHQILKNGNTIQTLSELGVVFLLFDIGLHFSLARMREQAANIFGFGPLQVLLGAVILGGSALLLGLGIGPSFLIGTTLALSSTAVVARLIAERHQQSCPVGVTATAILIFQDIAAIAILIVATAFGTGAAVLPTIGMAFIKAMLAFGAATIARPLHRPTGSNADHSDAERGGLYSDGPLSRTLGRMGDGCHGLVDDAGCIPRRNDPRRHALSGRDPVRD